MRNFVLTAIGTVMISSGAQAAMFTNGSFEAGPAPNGYLTLGASSTAIDGWTVTGGSVDYIGSLWAASDGTRSLDLAGSEAGAIAQSFDTLVGRTYKVTYDLAGNPQGGDAVKLLSVLATGTRNAARTESFDTTGRSETAMGWSRRSYSFVADSATTTLSFSSITAGVYGPALDNVAVEVLPAVPEPATWAMMIGGFGLIGGAMRRRAGVTTIARA